MLYWLILTAGHPVWHYFMLGNCVHCTFIFFRCTFIFFVIVFESIFVLSIDFGCRVFTNCQGGHGSILDWVIPKTQKWYSVPPCLTFNIITYVPKVKWSNQGKEYCPPLHLGVAAIKKGAHLITIICLHTVIYFHLFLSSILIFNI